MRDGFSELMSMPMHLLKDPETEIPLTHDAFVHFFIATRRASVMIKGWLGNEAERQLSPAPSQRE